MIFTRIFTETYSDCARCLGTLVEKTYLTLNLRFLIFYFIPFKLDFNFVSSPFNLIPILGEL